MNTSDPGVEMMLFHRFEDDNGEINVVYEFHGAILAITPELIEVDKIEGITFDLQGDLLTIGPYTFKVIERQPQMWFARKLTGPESLFPEWHELPLAALGVKGMPRSWMPDGETRGYVVTEHGAIWRIDGLPTAALTATQVRYREID